MAQTEIISYPKVGYAFRVEFAGLGARTIDTMFQEVGGLSRELSIETLEEGGENRFVHQLPGPAKNGNLSLKRGVVTESALIAWFEQAIQSLSITPLDVTVSLMDADAKGWNPIITWSFVKAWPVKWSVSNLNASSNALAIDSIELAYQFFRRR